MPARERRRERRLLVVEDSPEDFVAIQRTLRRAGMTGPIQHCADGDEALDLLLRRGAWAPPQDATPPDLVLLDLNLPATDGREVLRRIRAEPSLCSLPVIVMTTSTAPKDVQGCYRDGANAYVRKSVDAVEFKRAIESTSAFWCDVAVLPERPRE